MAGIDILDLVEATEVNETNDYLAIVDKSDTSQDITGSTKKITVKNLLSGLLDLFYPVGTIYETTSSDLDTVDKVNAHFGGTWEFYGAGRVLVAKSMDTEFDTTGKTGGEKTHTLTVGEMPSHKHSVYGFQTSPVTSPNNQGGGVALDDQARWTMLTSSSQGVQNTGGGGSHNNLQPYITVYRYRRIS